MPLPDRVPKFAELPVVPDAPPRSAWGVFGRDDQLGTLNFLTPERRRAAAQLVRRGVVFNLDLPLNLPVKPLIEHRTLYKRTQFVLGQNAGRDDYLDGFYLQASSQWDGLRHVRHSEHGFYNWTSDDQVDGGDGPLGMQRYAECSISGRGVLLDVARHLRSRGDDFRPDSLRPIPCELLDQVAEAEQVALSPGDIVAMRTGLAAVLHQEAANPERAVRPMDTAGLLADDATLAWLWDHQLAAVVSDNVAVEMRPWQRLPGVRRLHDEAIPLLGLFFGELFDLEALAEDCANDGLYEFLFVSKPLMLPGGVGSPANALAMK
ncbi:MAG: cyclase family protein [Chloroflexota bacterium]|nr:cyclase family protein [Chloroflexota bacterium]